MSKKLIVIMIVKNESHIIERCLNSVFPVADAFAIVDTGSTDNTIELIQKVSTNFNIPGKVISEKWVNFGHNRTQSFNLAIEVMNKNNWDPQNTYGLFIDADMIMRVDPKFDKENLNADSYSTLQFSGENLKYYLIQVVCLKNKWESIGSTHEYWKCLNPITTTKTLNTISFENVCDGGSRQNKFKRDLQLLKKDLINNPNDTRTSFYYAMTLYWTENYEEALIALENCINLNGWPEEIFEAKLTKAHCYKLMNKPWSETLTQYLIAFSYFPHRAEPLYAIASYYQEIKDFDLAFLFAKKAFELPYPDKDILFVNSKIYNYSAADCLACVAWYVKEYKIGKKAAIKALKYSPNDERLIRNVKFYKEIKK